MAAHPHAAHRVPVYRRPIFIINVLIIAALVCFVFMKFWPKREEANNPSTDQSTTSTSSSPTEDQKDDEEPPASVTQFEGKDPNRSPELSGRIAYRDISMGTLTIMASIDQYLTNGGECNLSLQSGSREVYTADLPATADVTTSVCGPFKVPLDSIPQGSYNLEIHISSGGKIGTIREEINI